MSEPMHVACATDANYLPHCAAMLASLFESNRDVRAYVLFDPTVSEAQRRTLTQWAAARGADVRPLVPSEAALPAALPQDNRLSRAAWLRVLLPGLLPEVSRVIYLDVDIIVQDSLRELWTLDLHGHLVAAVTNVPHWYFHPEESLGLSTELYFNSGVLVMDLEGLRRERIAEQSFAFALAKPHLVRHADQAPLNVLLHARRHRLHLRWNVQSPVHEGETGKPCPFSDAEIAEALRRPAVVHYSGNWKPWQFRCKHPLRHLYGRYRAQTPWPEWQPEGRTLKHRVLRLLPAYFVRRLTEAYWFTRNAVGLGATPQEKRS